MQNKIERLIRRGDIYYLNFGRQTGSEQSGLRPVVITSNKMANKYSPVVLVSPITSSFNKKELPTHVRLKHELCGLQRDSQVLLEQIYTVDKKRLGDYIGSIDDETMDKVNYALEISMQIGRARYMYNKEMKIISEKVKNIEELDKFISMWTSRKKNLEEIYDIMLERETRINELEEYAKEYGINYRDYYNPNVNRVGDNLKVMVG